MITHVEVSDPPLLGVSGGWGTREIAVTRQFEELHQLIYRRGGIRPTNAAVEELTKLIFLRLWSLKNPSAEASPGVRLADVYAGVAKASVIDFKRGFSVALRSGDLVARTPHGATEPIWPLDEPFRLDNAEVLEAAVTIISGIINESSPSISDPFGTAFDALLSGRYDHSGGLGTYLTPSSVANMMMAIARNLLHEYGDGLNSKSLIGDPYCGTGRFLVAAAEMMTEFDGSLCNLFGADLSSSAVAKARMNLMLYGIERPLVWTVEDSVIDGDLTLLEGSVDLILTNPPFGEGKYENPAGVAQTAAAIPRLRPRKRIDPAIACLVRCVRLLKAGGMVGIILPDGLIESRAFDDLLFGDSQFASELALVANVSLPTATFALSGTVAKTSAVFLKRGEKPRHVALARVDHVGYLKQAGKATEDPLGNELPDIPWLISKSLRNAQNATLSVESQAPLVAAVDLTVSRSYNPARIDPVALASRAALENSGGVEVRNLLSTVPRTRSRLTDSTPFVSVLHVDDLGTVAWHEAASYRPTTPGVLAKGGDIIISLLNPSKFRAAVIPERYANVQISAEFGVFRAEQDPYGVLALLYSEDVRNQLRPLGRGTSSSRRRIDEDDVLSLVVPYLPEAEYMKLARTVRASVEMVAKGRAALSDNFQM